MRLRHPAGARRGVGATELAIILPVLTLLALGCVDLGRFVYHQIAVTNAARAGAEYAIMNPYTPANLASWRAAIQQRARDELTGQTGCEPTWLTTNTIPTIEEPSGLRRVQVEATYSSFQTLVSWPGLPSSVTLRSTVVMRAIR
jgi:Flp pilus assembly protein TadG